MREREIWVVSHQYSCGGYWLGERFPFYTWKGETRDDGLGFWLLSGRMEVLNKAQVITRLQHCRDRGENVKEVWADSLPDGGFLLNV